MAITINVNGLSLCHRGSGGISDNTLPDVCKTPGNGTPVPYQNQAHSRDLIKGTTTVFADGGNMIANYGSQFSKSIFDEGGSMGGVVSGTNKAETDWISHSFDVFFEGKPACRLTDKLFMNHRNTVNMAGLKQRDLPQKDQDFLDEMCEMACACLKEWKGKLKDGQTYQNCVREKIDEKYYDGRHPKPDAKMWREIPYDRESGWDLIGSKANPDIPTSAYVRPDSRRLDVAEVENGQVKKLYDMKFGKDELTENAQRDYRDIAERHTGDPDNFEEFRVDERCDCDDDWPPKGPAPVTVPAPVKEDLLDKFGKALQASTGLKLTGGALIAVFIVSEATRVFPLRNAAPIP
ncbi:DUF4150 domain-containing protein [Robbsia andropogonis]|uniref:DUF4150 domain-containing protein n=1 Tax=Robbsia andropogonis TaxID=28092 RepID=UPI002A6B8AB5|nr:DUF4150 domain-containing protein [Robbsia andropogonis]